MKPGGRQAGRDLRVPARLHWKRAVATILAVACFALAAVPAAVSQEPEKLFVNDRSGAAAAAEVLEGQARADALALARVPSATWFMESSPEEARAAVADVMDRAAAEGAVPVLVAYNIPHRDCALYSAGGARDTAAYIRWIEAFAAGIGKGKAIVVLEPDGLGVIPFNRNVDGDPEPCRPEGADPAHAAAERFAQLSRAVEILKAMPGARVYLDGTGSNWLPPGDAADRLTKANIGKADGFFLNVSNFESDDRITRYAAWLSDCLALVTAGALEARSCPSQFHPANDDDMPTWAETDRAYDRAFAEAGLTRDPVRQKHAVIDTSRNGAGSWNPPDGRYKDAETWCNPPGRGLGRRPTLQTDNPYIDAFLWIKVPGESDGPCHRGTPGPLDPARGIAAPPAGNWFPDQARELIQHANPPFGISR